MADVNEPLSADDIKIIRASLQLKKLALLQEWQATAQFPVDKINRVTRLMAIMDEILKED